MPSLIQRVQVFCETHEFEVEFESFAREHSDVFQRLLHLNKGDEHPIEFYDVYNLYLAKFEGRIEEFVVQVIARIFSYVNRSL